MALSYKALMKTITALDAAGTTYDWTGFGFDPKVVFFTTFARNDAVDAVGRGTTGAGSAVQSSFGAATSATERGCATAFYSDNATAATGGSRMDDAAVVMRVDATGVVSGALDFSAWITDGVRVVIDNDFSVSEKVLVEAWGGSDLTDVKVKAYMTGIATGNVNYTGVGFDPGSSAYYRFWGCPEIAAAVPAANEDVISMTIGAARSASPIQQYVTTMNDDDDSATMDVDSYSISGECLASITPAGGASCAFRASFVGSITDGFTLNIAELGGATSRPFFVMILKGGSYHLGDLLTQTDITTPMVESGFGFQPVGATFVSHCRAQSAADTTRVDGNLSLGCCTSTADELCMSVLSEDATANMEVSTAIGYADVYVRIAADSTRAGAMKADTFPQSDGFTTIMSDADPDQALVWYSTYGNAPIATQPSRSMHQSRLRRATP